MMNVESILLMDISEEIVEIRRELSQISKEIQKLNKKMDVILEGWSSSDCLVTERQGYALHPDEYSSPKIYVSSSGASTYS